MSDNLDFSDDFDLSLDRGRVIEDAARLLDARASHLGPGSTDDTSEAGDIARAFAEDQATLGRPVVHRLELSALEAKRSAIPVTTGELTRNASFCCLSFPVSLFSRPGRGFNRLEVKMEFNPDDEGVRPTSFDVLPDQRWATKFQVGAEVSAGVSADLKLVVDVPQELAALAGVPVVAGASARAGAKTNLLLGPFEYALRVPQIVHSPAELDHVFWRLDGGSFLQEQDPGLRVVLRLPNDAAGLRVVGYMQATRYYKLLQTKLTDAILDLPAALRSFFSGGTPIGASGEWDLSEDL